MSDGGVGEMPRRQGAVHRAERIGDVLLVPRASAHSLGKVVRDV